jgi:hypothetical protein
MIGLNGYNRNTMMVCKASGVSWNKRFTTIEQSLIAQYTPEIARINDLQNQISRLKSEFERMRSCSGVGCLASEILGDLKCMQAEVDRR